MAEKRKYHLKIQGHRVEVPKEIYLTYYRVERHTRTLDEKDVRNGKVLYSDLDTEEMLGGGNTPGFEFAARGRYRDCPCFGQ